MSRLIDHRWVLCVPFVCVPILWGACPSFPDSELNTEGGVSCVDRDGDGVETCAGDCDDGQRDIFPGQSEFFEAPTGPRRYDYDCDGTEQPEYPDLADCREDGDGCAGEGWRDAVPACGEEGSFTSCERVASRCAAKNAGKAVQRCH